MERGPVNYEMRSVSREGVVLALHCWKAAQPRAVVFYIHGTQSHAGWLFETGPRLAGRGIALLAMDRRGSGQSEGERGDTPDFHAWIEDYLAGLAHARSLFPQLPLTILGQSMGGSIAMGMTLDERADFDALLLCTPALNHLHCAFDEPQQQHFAAAGEVLTKMRVPLEDAGYTDLPRYRDFMREDELMMRECTARTLASLYALESHYMARAGSLAGRRAALVLSATDAIINNSACREAFDHLLGGKGLVIEMPAPAHFIEFSEERGRLCGLIESYATTAGFACPE